MRVYLFIICFFIAIRAWGFGGVVTDPISYTYYVQQLTQMTEQISQGKESIENLSALKDKLNDLKSQFVGNYNQAAGLVEAINRLRQETVSLPNSISMTEENLKKMISDFGTHTEIEENLKKAFDDPRSENYNPWITGHYRYNMRQLSAKNTIKRSNTVLNSQEARLAALDELAAKIDSTENPKEAMDLNNRILVELVKGQIELLAITSAMAEMSALNNYTGIEPEEADRSITTAEEMLEENEKSKSSFVDEILDLSTQEGGYKGTKI